jgi:hypothetical protein
MLSSLNSKANYYRLSSAVNYSDTTVLPQILSLSLQNYVGLPVDSLFDDLPGNFSQRNFLSSGRWGYSRGLYQLYGTQEMNHVSVQIFIDTFQFLPIPNYNAFSFWNMNLAKQEAIAFIKIWKNNQCIYGCNNPNYD